MRGRFGRTIAAVGILGVASLLCAAGGDDELLGTGGVTERSLGEQSDYVAECQIAKVLEDNKSDVIACHGATQASQEWEEVIRLGGAFRANAAHWETLEARTQTQTACGESRAPESQSLSQARAAVTQAETAAQSTDDALATAQALELARSAFAAAIEKEKAEVLKSTNDARATFASALATAENTNRSPADFRKAVRDPARRSACRSYAAALNRALSRQDVSPQESQDAAVKARVDDTIGKTTGLSSALTGASSVVEQPGAPDRIVYTVMSALGADSKTTGTQLLMTLNLASIGAADSTRPVASTALRNLFLRVGLPLRSTSGQTQAAGAMLATPGANPNVTRMTFVLGGSLLDSSDPRLADHAECFDFARSYAPLALNEKESASRSAERQLYYGSCAQIAANRDRLAWRTGVGVYTTQQGDQQKTTPEILAGALVYGPSDWLMFNLIGQRLLEPHIVNTLGAGVALNIDAGGQTPGSQWGRLSLETLVMVEMTQHDPSAGISSSTGWEARTSISAYGKILTGGIGQVSIGPRILSTGHVGLFATVALTYDADHLINDLLLPPPVSAASAPSTP
jgi:hypothetical protein